MTATTINTQQDAGPNPAPVSASLPRDGDGGEVEQQKPGNGSTEITSPSDVPELKALMDEIHEVNDKLVKDKWVLGKKLREFRLGLEKHKVKHGNWGDLIETEFGFSYQMASNCMCYSEAADWAETEGKIKNFLKLPDTAVCKLWRAGKGEALNEALRRFDNFERVKLADAEEIAKKYKPAPTENERPATPTEGGDGNPPADLSEAGTEKVGSGDPNTGTDEQRTLPAVSGQTVTRSKPSGKGADTSDAASGKVGGAKSDNTQHDTDAAGAAEVERGLEFVKQFVEVHEALNAERKAELLRRVGEEVGDRWTIEPKA